jgi:hypothetical protein
MLVLGYYHYSCQGVISFVFGWAKVWHRVVSAEVRLVENGGRFFFFNMLGDTWIPAFARMTVLWREEFFYCGGIFACFRGGLSGETGVDSRHG